MAAGQNFNSQKGGANRGQEVIVNETLVKAMNWKNPIGKKVKIPIGEAKIVGVISNFHLKSMHHKIEPLTIIYLDNWADALLVKISTEDLSQTISDIEKTFKDVLGMSVFEYSFLDDRFATQYKADQQEANLFMLFSILTLIISGLGLLGLIGFSLARRSKEIIIRRVFGASYYQILRLLFKEYGQIIIIGLLIVIPLSNYLIKDWLINFPYRLELSITHFAIPMVGLALFVVAIILLRSYSTTKVNPAKVLQEE
jgi:putative ABC transport system permease protein